MTQHSRRGLVRDVACLDFGRGRGVGLAGGVACLDFARGRFGGIGGALGDGVAVVRTSLRSLARRR